MRSFQLFAVGFQALLVAAHGAEGSGMEGGSSAAAATLSYYMPGANSQLLVGSVVAADATATTIKVQCPTDTGSSKCGLAGNAEFTKKLPAQPNGRTTFDGVHSHPTAPITTTWHCRVRETGSAKCDLTKVTAGVTIVETGKRDEKGAFQTVSVTGGNKKLREAAATTASGTSHSNGGKAAATQTGTSSGSAAPTSKSNAKPTSGHARGALVAGLMGAAVIAI
jgi:hypothetical protein